MVVLSQHSELYSHNGISVSPSWLVKGKSRYAIRTIAQLDFIEQVRPRARAVFMLIVGCCLILLSLHYMQAGARPMLIPVVMLAASLLLASGSALALYLARPSYRVDVVLFDRSRIALDCQQKDEAQALIEQLSRAMDWHRNADLDLDIPRESWLRQGVAHGTRSTRDPARGGTRHGLQWIRSCLQGRAGRTHGGRRSMSSNPERSTNRTRRTERNGQAAEEQYLTPPSPDAGPSAPVGPVVATRRESAGGGRTGQVLALLTTLSRRNE